MSQPLPHTGADDCPCACCLTRRSKHRYERVARMSIKRCCALCGGLFYLGNWRRQRDDGQWVHRRCEEQE